MNAEETAKLLTVVSSFDRRTLGEADVIAWHSALGDLRFDECRDAVIAHYARESEWMMPAHVRRLVIAARNLNHERHALPTSGHGLKPRPAWFRDELRAGYESAAPHWAEVWERISEDVRKRGRGGEPPKRGPRLGDNYRGIGDSQENQ